METLKIILIVPILLILAFYGGILFLYIILPILLGVMLFNFVRDIIQ